MALTNDPNYKKLAEWFKANAGSLNMRKLFEADKDRFIKFRLEETLSSPCERGHAGEETGGGRDADTN